MSQYLYRFTAHRPDFARTMTDHERAVMRDHVAYWRTQTRSGQAVLFGPVVDPDQSWGIVDVLPMPMPILRDSAT